MSGVIPMNPPPSAFPSTGLRFASMTVGTVRKLDQSRDPDPPRSYMLSAAWFKDPAGPLLLQN